MATYLSLINFTDQGIRNIKDSPKRLDATKRALQKLGGQLKSFYLTQGTFDGVLIFELPTEEALTTFLLTSAASSGSSQGCRIKVAIPGSLGNRVFVQRCSSKESW